MTVSVTITVNPSQDSTAVLFEKMSGKKLNQLHTFSTASPNWEGHIWDGRDLHIEEIPIENPSQLKLNTD
jgi:hypothetical protein